MAMADKKQKKRYMRVGLRKAHRWFWSGLTLFLLAALIAFSRPEMTNQVSGNLTNIGINAIWDIAPDSTANLELSLTHLPANASLLWRVEIKGNKVILGPVESKNPPPFVFKNRVPLPGSVELYNPVTNTVIANSDL